MDPIHLFYTYFAEVSQITYIVGITEQYIIFTDISLQTYFMLDTFQLLIQPSN